MSNYYFLWLCTEQWELIYYVAFIVLTIGLVIFAAKTYFFKPNSLQSFLQKH